VPNKIKKELVVDVQRLSVNPANFSGTENPFQSSQRDATMLGVPAPTASNTSSPNSGASSRVANATGSGRNKVALAPGHSIMDWIRLTNSGKDLTCGRLGVAKISGTELQQHNSSKDAWTAINGVVYNITPYIDFHPGGTDELLRAAGKDSTDLFNQIHSWVNYESMLQKCCVGRLIRDDTVIKAELNPPEDLTITGQQHISTVKLKAKPSIGTTYVQHPIYRWCDERQTARLIVDPKVKSLRCPPFLLHLKDDQELTLTVKLAKNSIYIVHLRLNDKVEHEKNKGISYQTFYFASKLILVCLFKLKQ
jgi:cytochrome-b5 reductase